MASKGEGMPRKNRKLVYSGEGPIYLPNDGRLVKKGDTTPDLPEDLYNELKGRPDFSPVKQTSKSTKAGDEKKEE